MPGGHPGAPAGNARPGPPPERRKPGVAEQVVGLRTVMESPRPASTAAGGRRGGEAPPPVPGRSGAGAPDTPGTSAGAGPGPDGQHSRCGAQRGQVRDIPFPRPRRRRPDQSDLERSSSMIAEPRPAGESERVFMGSSRRSGRDGRDSAVGHCRVSGRRNSSQSGAAIAPPPAEPRRGWGGGPGELWVWPGDASGRPPRTEGDLSAEVVHPSATGPGGLGLHPPHLAFGDHDPRGAGRIDHQVGGRGAAGPPVDGAGGDGGQPGAAFPPVPQDLAYRVHPVLPAEDRRPVTGEAGTGVADDRPYLQRVPVPPNHRPRLPRDGIGSSHPRWASPEDRRATSGEDGCRRPVNRNGLAPRTVPATGGPGGRGRSLPGPPPATEGTSGSNDSTDTSGPGAPVDIHPTDPGHGALRRAVGGRYRGGGQPGDVEGTHKQGRRTVGRRRRGAAPAHAVQGRPVHFNNSDGIGRANRGELTPGSRPGAVVRTPRPSPPSATTPSERLPDPDHQLDQGPAASRRSR